MRLARIVVGTIAAMVAVLVPGATTNGAQGGVAAVVTPTSAHGVTS